jgi:7,8-dihydropterin-6-yl-methyl-4-(beta-D-ribofuranosyl)aminobenzene 5'-phosphate synthase
MIKAVRISDESLPSVDELKLTVLVEDTANMQKPDLIAKHGLSLLVETSLAGINSRVLFDVGPPPDIILRNAKMLNADILKVDAIAISHGHYDHAGALLEVLRCIRQSIPVIAHPSVFIPKFALRPKLRFIGQSFDSASVRAAGGVPLLVRNPVKIAVGVMTSGEIARETFFEKTLGFYTVKDEYFTEDSLIDDQALIINIRNRGLAVLTGCAHSGIINTLRWAQKITGVEKVYAIVGGLHLAGADDATIQSSIEELARINPASIYPCHCTGSKSIHRLIDEFGNRCKPIQTGDVIHL